MNYSSNRYFAKNTESGTFRDITAMFDGVAILKVDGMFKKGKPVNIYTEHWINEQEEDFLITTTDSNDNPIVIRENVDIEVTFIVRQKYASNTINIATTHDNFVNYMTGSDIWLKSSYSNEKTAHCVCLDNYEPTTVNLSRGENSYMMGTLKLHCLDEASA